MNQSAPLLTHNSPCYFLIFIVCLKEVTEEMMTSSKCSRTARNPTPLPPKTIDHTSTLAPAVSLLLNRSCDHIRQKKDRGSQRLLLNKCAERQSCRIPLVTLSQIDCLSEPETVNACYVFVWNWSCLSPGQMLLLCVCLYEMQDLVEISVCVRERERGQLCNNTQIWHGLRAFCVYSKYIAVFVFKTHAALHLVRSPFCFRKIPTQERQSINSCLYPSFSHATYTWLTIIYWLSVH